MKMITFSSIVALSVFTAAGHAELSVAVSKAKSVGQRTLVKLEMRNGFDKAVESARAAVFITDDQGKVVGQGAKWVISGTRMKAGLVRGGTNTYNFLVTLDGPVTKTNLTTKVSFNRVILEGGGLADPVKDVTIRYP